MKTSLKLVLLGVALAVGGVANAANVNILPQAATGSSLMLLMKDNTVTSFYVEELGATTSQIKTIASLSGDAPGVYSLDGTGAASTLSVPSIFANFSSANVASFLSARAGHDITWTILGANAGNGTFVTGQQSVVLTSADDYLTDSRYVSGGDVNGAQQGITAFISNDINPASYVNGVSASAGWNDTNVYGAAANNTFIGTNSPNGATIGTAQYLYLLSNSEGVGANVYKSASLLQLNADGTISYTGADLAGGNPAPVPLPAAVWLLGSGLAGLVGIGRRRKLAVAA